MVTHYKTPWKVGKPWFDMLALQRGIDFDDIGVILISDGEESRLDDELFTMYPYEVRNITIPHAGVSGARNAGLDAATAKWVMICDFDDTFLSVNALYLLLEAAKDETKVYYTSRVLEETRKSDGTYAYALHDKDMIFNHGKMYRTVWLRRNRIRFNDKIVLHEDVFFNTLVQAIARKEQVGEIGICFYMFCWNPDSVSRQFTSWELQTYEPMIRQKLSIIDEFLKRKMAQPALYTIAKTIIDGYYDFLRPDWQEDKWEKEMEKAERWYATFVREYIAEFLALPSEQIAGMINMVRQTRVAQGRILFETVTLKDFITHIIQDVEPIPHEEWNI